VTEIALEELRGFERVVAVDMQPSGLARDGLPRFAVIDHHPLEPAFDAGYADIRVGIGAAATLLVEYLRADDPRRVSGRLATALLYGIRTDTQSLTRGVTAADVEAYAFLQTRADPVLLGRFERGTYAHDAAIRFGQALERSRIAEDVIVAWLGCTPESDAHGLADLADFCLSVEGVSWAVAGAVAGEVLTLAIRYQGTGSGAGELARRIAGDGDGGGHATMARVSWPAGRALERLGARDGTDDDAILSGILELLVREKTRVAAPVAAGGSVVDDDAELVR
jgi:nanoRNase/pAp phosphatase (c-di-AMP/oligoRNAs hydrolase)